MEFSLITIFNFDLYEKIILYLVEPVLAKKFAYFLIKKKLAKRNF